MTDSIRVPLAAEPLTAEQERGWRERLAEDRWGSIPRWSSQSVIALFATLDAATARALAAEEALRNLHHAITVWQGKDPAAEIYFALELTKIRAILAANRTASGDEG